MSDQYAILTSFALILSVVAICGGYLPLRRGERLGDHPLAAYGEAFAIGVFLGAGIIHMLSDAVDDFEALGYNSMVPHTICGAVLIVLVGVEHAAHRLGNATGEGHPAIALFAAALLSVHTFIAGTALGTSGEAQIAFVVFFALLCHKFAAAFALGMTLARSALNQAVRWGVFALFVVMLPLGILAGALAQAQPGGPGLAAPILTAIAAGTFLHLALLHGLTRGMLVKHCGSVPLYATVVAGFSVMALIGLVA